jgi:deoxycytidine triphosphate deaminase
VVILSDRSLREAIAAGRLVVEPFEDDALQPSSIDVRLDSRFRVFHNARYPYIDVKQPMDGLTELVEVKPDDAFILHPGEFVLGSSLEFIGIPDDLAARLEGKALALDTPVPTPRGWRTMGDLHPGDLVFDEAGEPCQVVATSEVLLGRPCREVCFSDGHRIIADLQHQWLTCDKNAREHHNRRARIVTTGQIEASLRVRDEWNHQIPLAGPAFWGSSEPLADGVVELAASLGFRPVKTKDRATLHGIDHGPRYRVKYTPDRPVFRLSRKLARQRIGGRHHRFRAIVDVREIDSVPVRCIQVDSPTGLFLVGRGFIPTHNSSLGRLGLLTHSTAGFLDPGFQGHVTLELSNVANLPITLYPGMRIGQIAVFQLTTPADRPYGSGGVNSKYQGQRGPTPSRYWENFRTP